jgi:hypothetical protein
LTAAVFGIFLTEFKQKERIENLPMEVSAPYLPANDGDDIRSWAGEFDPFADPEERRVLFAVFDSFRCVSIVIFFFIFFIIYYIYVNFVSFPFLYQTVSPNSSYDNHPSPTTSLLCTSIGSLATAL